MDKPAIETEQWTGATTKVLKVTSQNSCLTKKNPVCVLCACVCVCVGSRLKKARFFCLAVHEFWPKPTWKMELSRGSPTGTARGGFRFAIAVVIGVLFFPGAVGPRVKRNIHTQSSQQIRWGRMREGRTHIQCRPIISSGWRQDEIGQRFRRR